MSQYEYYPQPDIVKALEKHYLSLSQQDLVEEIEWPLLDGKSNPDTPMGKDVRPTGQKTRLRLVPYGCTQLRLTVFPEL